MDPFLAEVRIFTGNFAPKGWASCDGQILPLSQNTALFSLLGTTYGGDGKSTFALPNLSGRAPLHAGQSPGLSEYFLGEQGGSQSVTLVVSEIPAHNHNIVSVNDVGDTNQAAGNGIARSSGAAVYGPAGPAQVNMAPTALGATGISSAHNNMQPYLPLYFIIAMQGVYPPRS